MLHPFFALCTGRAMRKPSESSSEEESSSEKKSGQEVLEGERPAEQLDVAVKAPSPEKTPAQIAELKASHFDQQERQQKVKVKRPVRRRTRRRQGREQLGQEAAVVVVLPVVAERGGTRRRRRTRTTRRRSPRKPVTRTRSGRSLTRKNKNTAGQSLLKGQKRTVGLWRLKKNTETKGDEMVEVLDTSQKPAHPALPPKNKGEAAQHGKAKGKTGKVPKKKCPHCHQWVTSTPAGQDQHRWLNELCLSWQVYNNMPWETRQKSESWDKACHMAKTLKEARQTRGPDEAWDNRSLPGTVSPMTLRSSHVGVGKENPPAQSGGQSVAESVQPQEKPPAPQVVADSSKGTAGRREKKKRRRSSSSSSSSASAGRRKKGKNRVTINIR